MRNILENGSLLFDLQNTINKQDVNLPTIANCHWKKTLFCFALGFFFFFTVAVNFSVILSKGKSTKLLIRSVRLRTGLLHACNC